MKYAHFDIDETIYPFLTGIRYSFSVSPVSYKKISDHTSLEVISIKSQSSITREVLIGLPSLKLIVTRTVGTDHIDLEACKERGIEVKNIPDYGSHNIAEHALAMLLAGSRSIVQANEATHKGFFSYSNFLGLSLKGKTIGVIGTGKIGVALITLLKGFEMKVIAYDVFKNEKAAQELSYNYVPLEFLLKESNFISIHVPLFPTTHHLIGEKELSLVKNGAVLVNTSRGEIVDTKSLVKHISKFKAVCLDVVEDEKKFDKKNPLLKHNNVIITPHIGFYTDDSVQTIARKTEELITEYLNK